jgi:uncharacterized circularly permuted ATP-grasp superfamily protein
MPDGSHERSFSYEPERGVYDEALLPAGAPRPSYAELLRRLSEVDLTELAARVAREVDEQGVVFGDEEGRQEAFRLDPVPRVVAADEWERLEPALVQRTRALEDFVDDVYGERAIVRAGRVPARAIETCDHFEPRVAELPTPPVRIGVAGLDVVRDAGGGLHVLEDNVRTPSGLAYVVAARELVDRLLPEELAIAPRPLHGGFTLLAETLHSCAPEGHAAPVVVLLSDGPANSAWYEHVRIARELSIPLVTLDDLEPTHGRLQAVIDGRTLDVDVVYRRTDEDRLTDESGEFTEVGAAIYEPLRAGTLVCVNGFGTGVADDKLVHAYVEEMIRFYLDEEPLLPSVHTYDLADDESRAEVLDRLAELVVKPRTGQGGQGVVVGPHARPEDVGQAADAIRAQPDDYVAQEMVMLSRHPTVVEGRLEPRHVDLRPFVFLTPSGGRVLPGGLTRVALDPEALVVNSSQRGGAKDTWVLSRL